jgi:aryl-alcohol dehydrogenase-like predicted oxidoreductase
LAELRGWERLASLQLEYSLVERNLEREHVPAALELGLGLTPWSPLGSGLLTGKYQRTSGGAAGQGRLSSLAQSGNPAFLKLFTERNWAIVDELVKVAQDVERPPAQVALAWLASRPAVTSIIIGATSRAQLDDNLASTALTLPAAALERLDAVSRPETVHPYHFFEPTMRSMLTGGTSVRR